MELEKIQVPEIPSEVFECPRCMQSYCDSCIGSIMVDFNIIDKSKGYREQEQQWENRQVCPWCYNQLIDMKLKKWE